MSKYDNLKEGLLDIFQSLGYEVKLYGEDGKNISNPFESRYIYVTKPNMMFILDESENIIEMHRSNFDFKTFKKILQLVRGITKKYFVRLIVSTYNQIITPKTFSRDVLKRVTNFPVKIVESKGKKTTLLISNLCYSDDIVVEGEEVSHNDKINVIIPTISLDSMESYGKVGVVLAESYIQGLISESSFMDVMGISNYPTFHDKVSKIVNTLEKQLR